MSASLSLFGPRPEERRPRRQPLYYQDDTYAQALADLAEARSTLAVMATGTGKTFTASMLIKRWPGRVLWLNERDNLVSQVRGELEDLLGEQVFIEQADVRAPSSGRVVVGSLQSMCQEKRLARFAPSDFSLIVADEAHHSVAPSYVRVFERFPAAKLFGLTATPRRHDGKALGLVYERQCADYQLHKGVADGYLVRVEYHRAERIDVSKLRGGGEFSDDQLAGVMGDDVLKGIAEDIIRLAAGKRGVLFFPRVDIARSASALLNLMEPGIADVVHGEQDRDLKRAILRNHKAGNFRIACNVGVIEEGHDDAGIEWVGMARPTKSWAKFVQWLGRCTRPLCAVDSCATAEDRRALIAASSKPTGIVYDFVGNTGKHNVMNAVHALAGLHDTEEVKRKAKEILDADEHGDVEKALDAARRMSERETREEAARVARVAAARYAWKKVDPFEALGLPEQSDVATALNRASERQRGLLVRAGIDVPPTLTTQDAQRLVRTVKAREKAGLADFRQVKRLSKHGIAAQRMYKRVADRLMDAIDNCRGWTPPQDVIDSIISRGRTPGEDG